ncbi:uncharacterized protein [Chelonus insularis]|uniref:uncharacterized protein n=1 Tax=Chelonus insularis TaxID=460826 RepID=UPI00158E6AF6|nr:uncharacterized protein LOC118064823 [Chelonus insularis]
MGNLPKERVQENIKPFKNTGVDYASPLKLKETQNIEWKFIPPKTPDFEGLWEAAVKSTEKHLLVITKDTILTFEECYTLLSEIEAILNSRPLTPLSNDPDELSVLTPGHFLVKEPLVAPAETDYKDTATNRLSRWQHIQKMRQYFWKR